MYFLPTLNKDNYYYFLGMFEDILRDVRRHPPKCLSTFPVMFGNIPGNVSDIPRNVWQHSPECLRKFPGMKHSLHSPRSLHSIPRSCIAGFDLTDNDHKHLEENLFWKLHTIQQNENRHDNRN